MTNYNRGPFTDDKVAIFREMWAKGHTYKQISEATGITASALNSSRGRYGMPPRLRVRDAKRAAAEVIVEARKEARVHGTLEPLPSLEGVVFSGSLPEATDVKIVSHKFLPEHKCGWPIGEPGEKDFRLCGCHSTTPGPYCDEHRALAYMTEDEADAAWKAVLGYHPRSR